MDVHTAWSQLQSQLHMIHNFKIPRYVVCKDSVKTQVHGFSDASEKAYEACVYLRFTESRGQHVVRLLCSKSRVAHLKTITLPRLELCGALLLARLNKTLGAIRFKPESVFYWTDSTIVLHWIKAQDKRWNTFVANRVGEIHRLSSPSEWHHVNTEFNPADHVSRGSLPSSLIKSELWWAGPRWLYQKEWKTKVPSFPLDELPEQKQKVVVSMVITSDNQRLFERFSSLSKLIRVHAYCLRFVNNIRRSSQNRTTGYLTAQELLKSRLNLVKMVQQSSFKEELCSLKAKGNIPRRSKLLSLAPFIDEQGIIRVGGRLQHAAILPDAKHPMLLPANHPFTCLIIAHEHHK